MTAAHKKEKTKKQPPPKPPKVLEDDRYIRTIKSGLRIIDDPEKYAWFLALPAREAIDFFFSKDYAGQSPSNLGYLPSALVGAVKEILSLFPAGLEIPERVTKLFDLISLLRRHYLELGLGNPKKPAEAPVPAK